MSHCASAAPRISAATNSGVIDSFPQPAPNRANLPEADVLRKKLAAREAVRSSEEASLSKEVVAQTWREWVWVQGQGSRWRSNLDDQDHRLRIGSN